MNSLDFEVETSNDKVMTRPNMSKKFETFMSTAHHQVLSSL